MATDAPQQQPASGEPPHPNGPSVASASSHQQDDQQPQPSSSTAPEAATTAPASPPLPPKPTPGPRAARLQEVYSSTLRQTLSKLSYANVAACYPTIAARAPNTLRSIQAQMVAVLQQRCEREFAGLLARWAVVERLNDLEALVAEADRRRLEAGMDGDDAGPPVAPHLLPPQQVAAAHLAPHLASQQSQLNARLQTTQARNAALAEEVAAQRDEAARLLAAADRALADVAGANGLLDQVVAALAAEARAVEAEMDGVEA